MKTTLVLTAAAVAAATLTATAWAHLPGAAFCSARQPAKVELRCASRDHQHALSTLRWFRNHPAAGSTYARSRHRSDRRLFIALPVRRAIVLNHRWLLHDSTARLKEARARLNPWPAHHRLWLCIHGGEAGSWYDRNSGGNGHYGGLQMHPGWGHGTAYYASDSSQLVQELAAEDGYRASRYSRAWLIGQWGQTIGPCWLFA